MSEEQFKVRRLVVWRHGRTTWNADGRYQGQADPPLDEIGVEQSQRAAMQLAADPPDLILTSDLLRASSTADALAELTGVPIKFEPRLREVDVGCWQGLTRAEVENRHPEQYAAWRAGRPLLDRGGETKTQLDARVLAALRDIDLENVLLVTHGGTSRSIIDLLLDTPIPSRRWMAPLGNCHWTELRRDPSGWRLWGHNLAPPSISTSPDAHSGVEEIGVEEIGDADAVDDGEGHVSAASDDAGVRT